MDKMKKEKWDKMLKEVDTEIKETGGHIYEICLKTRCMYCGRSPKQKGKCPAWLNVFFDKVYKRLYF